MFRPCDFAMIGIAVRQRLRWRRGFCCCAARLQLLVAFVVGMLGCRAPMFTTANLPAEYQAPVLPASTELNLERMGGWAVGSSQIDAGDLLAITVYSGSGD